MFKEELISRIQTLEIIQQVLLGVGVATFLLCLISFCIVQRQEGKRRIIA